MEQRHQEAFLAEGAYALSIMHSGLMLVMRIISLILVRLFATGTFRKIMLDFSYFMYV